MKTTLTIKDVELTYKKTELPVEKIIASGAAAKIARSTIPQGQIAHKEFFGLLLLNRANKVLARCIVSHGGLSSTVVDPKHVMQYAILSNAAGIVLFHNHPSGEVNPSENDKRITRRLREACAIFEIAILDHVILSAYEEAIPNYYSFADDGQL